MTGGGIRPRSPRRRIRQARRLRANPAATGRRPGARAVSSWRPASEILEEAGRPLHAAEILEGLTLRGLSVPGIDPVAALNTRLWKRSGPDGPFQRLGDAVYALAAGPDDE